ncbi:hypothetical protein D9757_009437 [Collybiopsis confluens]|uniref:AB hydrolase-1 domain-containing protein n=1 Tax=Collybiopsis confluens TaxID=2823264 RepID=A0A8H5M575_9AGAR|nr:hypothetical protein D9757_009437 [Collybiopsis confluens]
MAYEFLFSEPIQNYPVRRYERRSSSLIDPAVTMNFTDQFYKLHSCAHALNLRTVLLHRRHYAGSTPYTPSELEEIKQGRKSFWERWNAEFAEFLCIFITREQIPKLKEHANGTRNGGIAIIGWSLGAVPALSILTPAVNSGITSERSVLLEKYLGSCILYEPPFQAFGHSPPSDNPNYNPWMNPDLKIPMDQLMVVFSHWVSSYFDHPCYDPASHSLRSSATIHDFESVYSRDKASSVSSWTKDELARGVERDAVEMETFMCMPPMQAMIHELTDEALFDARAASICFPRVQVVHICGTRTVWTCAWTQTEIKNRYQSEVRGRAMQFVDVDGWNHFAHWDQPQQFMEVVASCLCPTRLESL